LRKGEEIMKSLRLWSAVIIVLLLCTSIMADQGISGGDSGKILVEPFGSSFTYQGRLMEFDKPASGSYELQCKIFDTMELGSQIGNTLDLDKVPVQGGLFMVELDFGASSFYGIALYLEIGVRPQDAIAEFEILPRQKLTSVPYANFTRAALNADMIDGIDSSKLWKLAGNNGTTSGADFIGTSDNQAVDFKVNNSRAFRLEPGASPNVIGGYKDNSVKDGVVGAFIGGGGADNLKNRVEDNYGTVGGGMGNSAGSGFGSEFATIGGGTENIANAKYSTVSGGAVNAAIGVSATVSGGKNNSCESDRSTIGGGAENSIESGIGVTIAGGLSNSADEDSATVGGGEANNASAKYATIGGGNDNYISGEGAAINGGIKNIATGEAGTISGGKQNNANDDFCSVGGGTKNSATKEYAAVSGGFTNTASGVGAYIGGGANNTASGSYSVIPGGNDNTAVGQFSFAAGNAARAANIGSFVWSDNEGSDFTSTADNQFSVRSTGGTRFVTAVDESGVPTAGVVLPSGGGAWSDLCDRNSKDNFAPVNGQNILKNLSEMDILYWSYKSQGSGIRHIGPVAQDFYKAFEVGEDEKCISTVDKDGVALAAIQELYNMIQEQGKAIDSLTKENSGLKFQIEKMKKTLNNNNQN
jgi:trimeric autotransporter adhesin